MHEQSDRSSAANVTRRGFVAGTLAGGFALAVEPVSADTITTDTKGLEAGEVQIPVPPGSVTSGGAAVETIPAYRAMPEAPKQPPVAIVVQEIFGVHEHIKDLCRRLAKQGYLAVAPELYFRQGDVSKIATIQEVISKVVSKVPDAQVMSDLDATVAWSKTAGGDTSRLVITGFCWGGRIVWLYAAHNPHLKAGVAWYGRLVGPKDELHPQNPLDLAGALKAPVLGLYGGQDNGIPLSTVEQMRATLKKDDKPSEIVVYPDAPHGFNADYRPTYRQADAQDGWQRMLAWFKK